MSSGAFPEIEHTFADIPVEIPVCTHHHTKFHDGGWIVTLGPHRAIEIRFPDGTIHDTGPPSRRAA